MSKKIPNLGWGQKRDSVSSFLHPLRNGEEAARGRTGLCERAAAQCTPVSAGSRTFSCVPSSKKRSRGGSGQGPRPVACKPSCPTLLRASELAASQGSPVLQKATTRGGGVASPGGKGWCFWTAATARDVASLQESNRDLPAKENQI